MAKEFKAVKFSFNNGDTEEKQVGDKTLKNVSVTVDEDTYVNALKDNDIDIKIVKKIEQFNEHYLKSGVKSTTENNVSIFKNNDMSNTVLPFGISARNHITVDSKKEVTIPFPGRAGEFIIGPQVKVDVKTTYTKVTTSYIRSMKDIIAESLANG